MPVSPDQPEMARPSLYATTKLVRIIQRVKDRLKARRCRSTTKMAAAKVPAATISAEVGRAIDRYAISISALELCTD